MKLSKRSKTKLAELNRPNCSKATKAPEMVKAHTNYQNYENCQMTKRQNVKKFSNIKIISSLDSRALHVGHFDSFKPLSKQFQALWVVLANLSIGLFDTFPFIDVFNSFRHVQALWLRSNTPFLSFTSARTSVYTKGGELSIFRLMKVETFFFKILNFVRH